MYKISVSKDLFKEIQFKKISMIEKKTSLFWKKELLQPRIENDRIKYSIKQIDKLKITNGLGDEKPQMVLECKSVDYSFKKDIFEFHLGRILEQKNTDFSDDYKDSLIEQLLKEKAQLEDSLNKDFLTGVYNRKKMQIDLNSFINQNNSDLLNVVFISVDKFKFINEEFGISSGDKVLSYLGKKLLLYAKDLNGEVYRYDGKVFAFLAFLDKNVLESKLESIRLDIKSQKIFNEIRSISVTISLGAACYKNYNSINITVKNALKALNDAKLKGRDKVVFL